MPDIGSGPRFRYLAVIGALRFGPRPPLVELVEDDVWPFRFLLVEPSGTDGSQPTEPRSVSASSSATVPCLVWGRARPRRDR